MLRTRQPDEPAVRGYAVTHPPGRAVLPIEAGWDQLLYAESGAMTVSTATGTWVIPAVQSCPLRLDDAVQAALLTVLTDQLRRLPQVGLRLPWPRDPRAADAARTLVADAAIALSDVAGRVGASRRTLERAFAADTGLSLGAWRRRANILNSLDSLAAGRSVTATAIAAGYTTPSAYVAAFRRELGQTPHQYLRP